MLSSGALASSFSIIRTRARKRDFHWRRASTAAASDSLAGCTLADSSTDGLGLIAADETSVALGASPAACVATLVE